MHLIRDGLVGLAAESLHLCVCGCEKRSDSNAAAARISLVSIKVFSQPCSRTCVTPRKAEQFWLGFDFTLWLVAAVAPAEVQLRVIAVLDALSELLCIAA